MMRLSFNVALFVLLFSIGSLLTVKLAFAAEIDGNWLFTLDTGGGGEGDFRHPEARGGRRLRGSGASMT